MKHYVHVVVEKVHCGMPGEWHLEIDEVAEYNLGLGGYTLGPFITAEEAASSAQKEDRKLLKELAEELAEADALEEGQKVMRLFREAMAALDRCPITASSLHWWSEELGGIARELIARGFTRDMTYPPTCQEGHPVCP